MKIFGCGRVLAVFLNRKLISCDTIVPLLMDLKAHAPELSIEIWVPDAATMRSIRDNVVLRDAALGVGTLHLISGREMSPVSRRLHQAATALRFIRLALLAVLGRATFLHFKALTKPPLRWFYKLAPSRTFLAENDSYGFTRLMSQVTFVTETPPPPREPPPAGALIGFSPEWHLLSHPRFADCPKFAYGTPRLRKVWTDYVRGQADRYFAEEFARAGIAPTSEVISVMLGYFGALAYMREPDVIPKLLRETLEEIVAQADGRAIFLKIHIITDTAVLEKVIAGLGGNIILTHVHPMVLATRSRFVVANYYSTTLADFHWMGVPTIEYTDYNEGALRLTSGGSMRPEFVDHFINHDRDRLRDTIATLLHTPPSLPPSGTTDDPSGVLSALSKG